MGNGKQNSEGPVGPPDAHRRRAPPPTIDLKATEVPAESVSAASEAPAVRSGTSAEPDGPDSGQGPASAQRPPEEQSEPAASAAASPEFSMPPGSGSSDEPPHNEPRRSALAWLPVALSWHSIGAGATGAVIVLLILWALGLTAGGPAELADRLARAESQLRELVGRGQQSPADPQVIDDLSTRIVRLERALTVPSTAPLDPAIADRLASTETTIKSLADGMANLNRRADEAAGASREARERADAVAKSLTEMGQQLAQQRAEGARRPTVERAELDQLARRITALEAATKAVGDELGKAISPAGDRAVRFAVLAIALKSAVERGDPYAAQLAAIKPFAADPKIFSPLEPFAASGVPSAAALAREVSALAPELLRFANASPREGGLLTRLQANAARLVRIRPIDEVPGDDPAAIIARLEVRDSQTDIAGALAEATKLPPAARSPIEPWIRKAEARNAAGAAAERLAAEALAALGRTAPQGTPER